MGAPASPQIIGRYAIYGKIAQGGMASVHFGRLRGAAGFSRTVAIKRLHPHLAEEPEFLATMIDEARLAARIHHPNVVPTLDVVAEGGELLVVMEYVRGESLSRLLRSEATRGRRVPLPIASAIVLGALHGLHAAHEATSDRGTPLGIVHRDVSPQNVLVGVDGVPRIIDFGVAKAAGRLQTTSEGVVKGKIAYMPPEQLSGTETSRTGDVYAMGVVFWELLCGRALFRGETEAALVMKVLAGVTDPPSQHAPNLPSGVDDLVMRSLAREASARFATALEMADVLVRLVPPALPRDVGAWVEELAHSSLSERATALAEIESISGMASVPPPKDLKLVTGSRPAITDPGDGSQVSNLSLEAPGQAGTPRRSRLVVGAIGVAALGIIGAAGLAWRGGTTAASAPPPSAVASAIDPATPQVATSAPLATAAPSSSVAPVQSAATPSATAVVARPARPPRGHGGPASPPPPASAMVRFSQPD